VADLFRRLFSKPRSSAEAAITAPLDEAKKAPPPPPSTGIPQLIAGVGQSVGKQRQHNEDSLLAITTAISGSTGNVPFGLYIIADGMGGHQFGEIASNAAVRIIAGSIFRRFQPYLFGVPSQPIQESVQEALQAAVTEAHRFVQREAPGSGTTVTAALALGEQVTIAHVGDSRAYAVYPDGRVEPITRDHSLVKRLEELGHLSEDEAATFPHRNVLIRAVGQGESIEVDVLTLPFPQPGYLCLCSDGLWGAISDEEIFRAVADAPTLERACQTLVDAANEAGGPDNISVILAQLTG